MAVPEAQHTIQEAVAQWPEVTMAPHRFGGVEFLFGRREIGHIHGDSLVDIPFPKAVHDDLIAAGRAEVHHVVPESGWVSRYLRKPADVVTAINLLRQSYELAVAQRNRYAAKV